MDYIIVQFPTGGEMLLELPSVSRTDEGVEQIKVFLRSEERDQVRKACQSAGIPMTYLARQLLVAWASQQENEKKQAS